jgi:multidrug efflux pump subunit AcrB
VIDGFIDADLSATHNGRPTAFVMVVQPDKMDIVNYADSFRDYIERANNPCLRAFCRAVCKSTFLWDNARTVSGAHELISESALLGAVLVMLVLILFLRPIVAFWVTIGIITAFAGGIMLMPLFGVSWNVLSTFAVSAGHRGHR